MVRQHRGRLEMIPPRSPQSCNVSLPRDERSQDMEKQDDREGRSQEQSVEKQDDREGRPQEQGGGKPRPYYTRNARSSRRLESGDRQCQSWVRFLKRRACRIRCAGCQQKRFVV